MVELRQKIAEIVVTGMPNTKSAIKAARASLRKRAFNQKVKTKVKSEVKNLERLIKSASKNEAAAKLREAMSAMDKAVKRGVMKKNTASRKKSRLAKALAKLK